MPFHVFYRGVELLQVDSKAYLFTALLLLTIPINWVLAAAFAAFWHEICHILMLRMLKGNIRSIHIQWNGCEIETDAIGKMQQFYSILAGPLGSLSLLVLCRFTPRIAICGLIQGIYNLLPVMPLDGGRLLYLFLNQICPGKVDLLMRGTELLFRCGMTMVVFVVSSRFLWNPLPAILLAICNIHWYLRKIPCKQSEIGVQ